MPEIVWLGTSVGTVKAVKVTPGSNITTLSPPPQFSLGLPGILFEFTGWDADLIVSTWTASDDVNVAAITASKNDDDSVTFTANNAGEDFEIVLKLPSGLEASSSTYQTLTFDPIPSGGTFKLTVAGNTTGNINWNATPATLATNIQNAIAAMSGFGSLDVVVTALPSPGAVKLDFSQGQFVGLDMDLVTVDRTSLTGGNAAVTTTVNAVGAVAVAGTSQVSTLSFPAAGTHSEKVSEIQVISSDARFGSFDLTLSGYGTTVKLPFTATRTQVQEALETVVGIGNVVVTGGPNYYTPQNANYDLTVKFIGSLVGVNMPTMTVTKYDSAKDEIQQIKMVGTATAGTFTLTFNGNTTSTIAFNADAPTVQAALEALASIGTNEALCSGGPLAPTGSPVTNTDILNVNMANFTDTTKIGGSNYVITDNYSPYAILDGTAGATTPRQMLVLMKVDGYVSVATLLLTSADPGVSLPGMVIGVAEVDNASLPLDAAAYNALTFWDNSAAIVSGSAANKTAVTAHGSYTLKESSYTVSTYVNHIRSRAGWKDGNYILFRITSASPTYTYNVVDNTRRINNAGGDIIFSGCNGNPFLNTTTIPGAYGPIVVKFAGTLAAANQPQITANSAGVTGGSIAPSTILDGGVATYTVTTTQTGGTSTVANIKGGTFSLTIAGKTVTGIPYNTSAANLVTLINTAFGATVCSATGGPAPDTAIVITFSGTLATQPITTIFQNALLTSLSGSVTQTTVRNGATPVVPTNVFDLVVCPGQGTLGISDSARIRLSFSLASPTNSGVGDTTFKPLGDALVAFGKLEAYMLEAVINEFLAADACRVTKVGHSEEVARILITATGEYTNIWYFKDTYRIVFVNDFAASGSINITATFEPVGTNPSAAPSAWMSYTAGDTIDPDAGDAADEYPETKRVVMGFVAMETSTNPLHICTCTAVPSTPRNNLSWRFKLLSQAVADDQVSDSITNSGVVQSPGAAKIQFQWNRMTIDNNGVRVPTVLARSADMLWDSPATVIQSNLEDMFFGIGNIFASGSLINSWKSESLYDAPVTNAYNELHVTLGGLLKALPIDEYDYTLTMTIVDTDLGTSQYQKPFKAYGTELTRTLPPYVNRRESIAISDIMNAAVKMGCCNLLADIPSAASAGTIQGLLDTLFGFTSVMSTYLPERLIHPIVVYGTNFLDGPIEFEFVSGGSQFNDAVTMVVNSQPTNIIVGKIIATTPGVLATPDVDANQLIRITGSPFGGTFTLTFSGNTTAALAYNVSLSALQSAVTTAGFSSPTITGNADNGFTFVWAGSGGPRAAITSASSLNNANAAAVVTHHGGQSTTFRVDEVTSGKGPNYLDDPNNFDLKRCLDTGDTLIVDDSSSAILYGLELTATFQLQKVKAGVQTVFQYDRNVKVFQPNQKLVFKTTGAAPTGMTDGTTYQIDAVGQFGVNSFSLKALDGTPIKVSVPGSGVMSLTVNSLTIRQYARFSGAKMGLPHASALPSSIKARFTEIQLGLGVGDGLSLGCFDLMDSSPEITVWNSARPDSQSLPSVFFIVNNNATNLTVKDGYVGVNVYGDQSGVIGDVIVEQGSIFVNKTVIDNLTTQVGAEKHLIDCSMASGNKLRLG